MTCVAFGTTHQDDASKFKGNNSQCVAMSTCAAIYSSILKRNIFSTEDIDTILRFGDNLYIQLRPPYVPHNHPFLDPEELPSDIRIGKYLAKIKSMADNDSWVQNGLFPSNDTNRDYYALKLKLILENEIFSSSTHNDFTHSYLFTGANATVSFWRYDNSFFLFNSHAVYDNNKYVPSANSFSSPVARLFKCSNLISLANLLFWSPASGGEYQIHKIELKHHVQILNEVDQSINVGSKCDSKLVNLEPIVVVKNISDPKITILTPVVSIAKLPDERKTLTVKRGRPKKYKKPDFNIVSCKSNYISSNSINEPPKKRGRPTKHTIHKKICLESHLTDLNPIGLTKNLYDPKLTTLIPIVSITKLADSEINERKKLAEQQNLPKKLSQPTKHTINKISRLDSHFRDLNPIGLTNKIYDPKLTTLTPVVSLTKLPDSEITLLLKREGRNRTRKEISYKSNYLSLNCKNESSKKQGRPANPTSNKKSHLNAVKKYTEKNPEIHRVAVKKYHQNNPEIHREAVKKYHQNNPDVNRLAVEKYNQSNRNVDLELRPSDNFIGTRHSKNLDTIKLFTLKNVSRFSSETFVCQFCEARLFFEEKNRIKWCCGAGAYNVQNFPPLTEEFYSFPAFVLRPRAYNNLFAFSALGVTHGYQHPNIGISFLKIQGRIYHRVFDLAYSKSTNPIGLYIVDENERQKLAEQQNLDLTVIRSISNFIETVNPYVECFKRLNHETSEHAHIIFERTTRHTHGNILGDIPLGKEIAAIINTEQEKYIPHAIAIWKIGDKKPHTVDIMHPLYETLQYPLLYPHGNPGWYPNKTDNKSNKLSQTKYVRCLLLSEPRFSDFNRLSEEWLVDMQCRILEERLRYLYNIQKGNTDTALRTAPLKEIQAVMRQINSDEIIQGEGGVVPGRVYLPSSHTGGPRYMKQKYMDAIAIVNRLGLPSFLLTLTCNPKWPEIKNSITGNYNTPSICSRVFNLKLQQLLRDLRTGAWLGKTIYILHVIEFQKRGLPHAHICFAIDGGGPIHGIDVDKYVRADISNATEANGKLRKAVLDYMIHGPCGPPYRTDLKCWDSEKKKCNNYFPKVETDVTYYDNKGYINLKRNSKNTASITYRQKDIIVNDLWVVPYNAALLLKYDCHINLEPVSTRTVVKYLFKYMTKGPDQARVTVVPEDQLNNEIEQYVTKRYIGSGEAAWRIFEFDITGREPTVKMLDVHLENNQLVFFKAGNEEHAIRNSNSDLITYFNRPVGDEFNSLTYLDFYEKYIVHASRPSIKNTEIVQTKNHKFITKRQRGEIVTRLFWVAPNRGEQFYLRLLLSLYPCRSYRDLYNLGGSNCNTFQEAAQILGIANNEAEYEIAMREASGFLTGPRLRSFFVLLAVNGIAVGTLWEKFKSQLTEDIMNRENNFDVACTIALVQIDRLLRKHGTCLLEQGLPNVNDITTELARENNLYNTSELRNFIDIWFPKLSDDQRQVFNYVQNLLVDLEFRDKNETTIFIDGPAGTGKTLLLNTLVAYVRGVLNGIVLCTASSGIAAQNYENGATAHSMFRYPLYPVDDLGYWNITNGSQRAELILHADLIIYDEISMVHKYLIHLLDRSLQDLTKSNKCFGGKILIFAGDFRQIPPVVSNAKTNSDIINASVKSSPIWQSLKTFSLVTPQRNAEDDTFSEFLLNIGNNNLPIDSITFGRNIQKLINVSYLKFTTDLLELINFVFSDFMLEHESEICVNRAILSTHNSNIKEINTIILERLPGEILHFYSIDKIATDNTDELFLGPDVLNSLNPRGIPEHDLTLKIGCICMIIRNLSFSDHLLNGTKVIVVAATPRLITVRKPGISDLFFIPRIVFKAPIDTNSPIEMCRLQFPLQVCYAMTIHKSQGQTINRVGVDLRSDIFSHGQLYVALGRVRERDDLKILIHKDRLIKNIPYVNNVVISQLL